MTGSAAKAGHAEKEKDKEKTGIRRALGRGLESLLPGPRRVSPELRVPSIETAHDRVDVQTGTAANETEIPRVARDDTHLSAETIQALVDSADAVAAEPGSAGRTRASAPPFDAAQDLGPGPAEFVQAAQETEIPHFVRNDNRGEVRNDNRGEVRNDNRGGVRNDNRVGVPNDNRESEPISIQASAEGRQDSRAGAPAPHGTASHSNLVVQIPLDSIDENPYQTRNFVDKQTLEDLAESIKAQGVVQPVVVRPGEGGRYVLILGERRCRASKMAGKTAVPAIVRRVSDQQAAEMTIIENLQREDLNCMEQAKAFGTLSTEFKLTQEQIGRRVGKSREAVSNYMRLLRLPQTVIDYLENNQLAFSDARELMMLNDDKLIARAADIAVKKHLSIEKIEDLVMEMQGFAPPRPERKSGGARWVDPNVRAAQTELERLLGVRVRIRDRRGRGKIVIEYSTVEDYERVVEALRGKSST